MKKKVEFESSVADLAKLTKAIGHPARITIMLHLMEEGACTCQQVVDELPYSQSTVSGHLQKLKEEGLIKMKSYKTSSIYSMEKEVIQRMSNLLNSTFNLGGEKKQLSLF